MGTVIKDVLFHRRQYFIEKVQAPLLQAIQGLSEKGGNLLKRIRTLLEIVDLAQKYPELTKDNVIWKNTRIRLEIREYFRENLTARGEVFDIGLGLLNAKCEVDGFYEFLHDEYIVQLLKRGWQPAKRGFPMYRYWKGNLPEDYCKESSPEWFPCWLERRNNGTLVEKEKELVNK